MSDANETQPLLHGIERPSDLRKLPRDQVEQAAAEIRQEILSRVSQTGGHLASLVRTAVGDYTLDRAVDEARLEDRIMQVDLIEPPAIAPRQDD